jgi:hypothetical protein
VFVSLTAGLSGVYWQSRDLAGLCRPWGHDQQSKDCVGLGGVAQCNRAPAGLGGAALQRRDLEGCAGFGVMVQQKLCRAVQPWGGVAWQRS